MKANELRIGNLLEDKLTGALLKVVALNEENNNITTYVIDRSKYPLPNGWQLQPIPLTEEWLLKFGFEKMSEVHFEFGKYFWFELHIDQSTVLKTKNGEGISVHYNDGDENNCIPFDNCKTVHQLQNLYFALTGEELTINL